PEAIFARCHFHEIVTLKDTYREPHLFRSPSPSSDYLKRANYKLLYTQVSIMMDGKTWIQSTYAFSPDGQQMVNIWTSKHGHNQRHQPVHMD
ncbi:unnamed protein product, partial [Thlaspi arvense]